MAEIEFDNTEEQDLDLDDTREILGEEPQGFWTQRRLLLSGLGIIIVLAVGMVVYSLRSSDTSGGKILSKQQAAEQAKQEKKKKKKNAKFKKLFSQLTLDQQTIILKELSFQDIEFQTEQNGNNYTILVDEEDLEHAKSILAIKGLPSGGSKGYELLDNSETLGVTEFDKRVRFLRALSGELEKAIIQFDAIENAKVQIVLPEQKLFAVTQPPVTTSILIRKKIGHEVTDENVYSIIQLVANAVENLQPENVSVIDTEGRVLSNGIFERMAAKQAPKEEATPTAQIMTKIGTPVIPDFKQMEKWLEIKHKFEKDLEDKAIRQLLGILPVGSFKLSLTADLGPVEEGKVPEVLRLTVSVVVDGNNKDIYLDNDMKTQIFNTVAGAIGYNRDRDNILLTRADFFQISSEELNRQRFIKYKQNALRRGILAIISLIIGWLTYMGIKRLTRNIKLPSFLSQEREELDTNFDVETNMERIQDIADSNPQALAEAIESWLQEPELNEGFENA